MPFINVKVIESGDRGIAGNALPREDVRALAAGIPA
jgi:phenylpyruvate tautomerase PptA (4-oxalocrotonate tautomerase family)